MTVNYLKHQKSQIALQATYDPAGANERLEDLKKTLEAYIEQYGLPEMWANELRRVLDA